MEALEILLNYKKVLNEVKSLLNWYDRYSDCIFMKSNNEEINAALTKLNRDYYKLLLLINTDIAVSSSINSLFRIIASDHVNIIDEDKLTFVNRVLNFLDDSKEQLLRIFNNTDEQGVNSHAYYFDEGFKDVKSITGRMEIMIRNSQRLHQPYFKISA
jgi:hypothetical protein